MKITPNENLYYYFYFLTERMDIFWAKKNNAEFPYTKDEILNNHKFTNTYRVLDRVSQYLIKNIQKKILFLELFFLKFLIKLKLENF